MIASYYKEINYEYRLVEKNGQLGRPLNKRVVQNSRNCYRRHRLSSFQRLHSILISYHWTVVIFLISMAHLGSWVIFALLWYIVSLQHGDFENGSTILNTHKKEPCLLNVESNFLAFFLFSIETQATIGYGHYRPSNQCVISVVLLALQATIGVLISIFSAGIVLNKLVKSTNYESMITFSHNAVVSHRDGHPCFMVFICNPHRILVTDAHVSLLFIQLKSDIRFEDKFVKKGPSISSYNSRGVYNSLDVITCYDLQLSNSAFKSGAIFLCPTIIEHYIDKNSALYPYLYLLDDQSQEHSRCLALDQYFEVVLTVEGVIEATGNTCHYRTSYIPEEIYWNYRFSALCYDVNDDGHIIFNADEIGTVEPVALNKEEIF
ncbi:hypothetical protein GJ496_002734 [Pomphorhynchus laevis]|nr:hypothetical protein GJ496_002734 [Pomphorhynchus laevis]